MNTQDNLSKIHTRPIYEKTNIEIFPPTNENLDNFYKEFIKMSDDQRNELLNMFVQKNINPTEKTFQTIGSNAINIISERLKKSTNESSINESSNEQLTNELSNEQLMNKPWNELINELSTNE